MKFFIAKNTAKLFMYAALFFVLWVFITGLFIGGDSALDINIHDTYYVIGNNTVAILFCVLHMMLALVYWFVKPKINVFNFIHLLSAFLLPLSFNGFFLMLIAGEKILLIVNTIGIFYLIATILFLINVTYTLIIYLIKPK